jgi:hypothetical protein
MVRIKCFLPKNILYAPFLTPAELMGVYHKELAVWYTFWQSGGMHFG